VQGIKQGKQQGTGHQSLWGTIHFVISPPKPGGRLPVGRPSLSLSPQAAFTGEAYITRQAKQAELVENGPIADNDR
jgi:hypothetical protein